MAIEAKIRDSILTLAELMAASFKDNASIKKLIASRLEGLTIDERKELLNALARDEKRIQLLSDSLVTIRANLK